MLNALTIDVEEYFHPTEVQPYAEPALWSSLPSRVEMQTHQLLEIFEESRVRATFFILGWIAERHGQLLRNIVDAGHEIGCHSFAHQLVYQLTPDAFRRDKERAIA